MFIRKNYIPLRTYYTIFIFISKLVTIFMGASNKFNTCLSIVLSLTNKSCWLLYLYTITLNILYVYVYAIVSKHNIDFACFSLANVCSDQGLLYSFVRNWKIMLCFYYQVHLLSITDASLMNLCKKQCERKS